MRDRRLALGLRNVAHLHAEGDVLLDRHVRIEGVGLEHHGDVASARMKLVDPFAVDADVAVAHRLEPGDGVEECRFPAARWADEHEEIAFLDLEVDVFQHLDLAEALAQMLDLDERHLSLLPRRP